MDVDYNICTNCVESCCSYKKNELEYTPTFTKDEVEKIEKKFGKLSCFRPFNKAKTIFDIKPVKSKNNPDLYFCPFFDEKTKACKNYELRSLDCKLFPFTFVRINGKIYLAMVNESLCPLMKTITPKFTEILKKKVFETIKKEKAIEVLRKFPDLIIDYDEDDNEISLIKEFDLNKE